ncbi:TPA: hypothetical protein IX699_000281 [Enterococcus faecium]|uniref:hypothetical protein n=1 Tax=Enterococcus faecium TaxID=1352 RepID=UPI0002A1A5CC|nr:hypothetical protein [Enterococcus faecium]ELB81132.1 hypothetical protein OMC_05296 [Enterococcus faecium EnGen0049]ELB81959.1 hypothetical protein OMA_04925 [Enterococcus faecium EnGen0045]MWG19300.1 hypothetical protein [Enterococcus faecium]HAQ6362153.1 hypothetical protein [Enterococcus faecium]HAQ6778933.1 hypothetical protein [Enterococcus faecium]
MKEQTNYFNQLLNKRVVVITTNAKKLEGILIKVTKYELFLEQIKDNEKTGQVFICFKHAVKYLRYQK